MKHKTNKEKQRGRNPINRTQGSCNTRGFTLIEIMVSVAIFTVIITTGMGALVSLLRNYEVTQNQKKVHDGLNYAFESMTREIRLGKNYYAGSNSSSSQGSVQDGDASSLGFDSADARGYIRYYLDDGALVMERTDAAVLPDSTSSLTDSTQVTIENIDFNVVGTGTFGSGDFYQPMVWMQIEASATGDPDGRTTTIQTLVSQRSLDF